MDAEEHYLILRTHFEAVPEQEMIEVTMEQVTELLDCSRRNAQLVLNKLMESGCLKWIPGRGRGNVSRMSFQISISDLLAAKARQLVEKEHLNEAWRLIESSGTQRMKNDFADWLELQLGILRTDGEEREVLRFPFYRPVPQLDPAWVQRRTESHWVRQIFDTLLIFDPEEKRILPGLAHHWEWDESSSRWRFYLRKGVRFHHGQEMTARDVRFTFARMAGSTSSEWMLSLITDVQMQGRYCIDFYFAQPNAVFPAFLCTDRCSIVPEDLGGPDRAKCFSALPIGTGPFRMIKNNESLLVLEANDHYFEGRPHLDRIEMWVWPDYEGQPGANRTGRDMQLLYSNASQESAKEPSLSQLENGSTYLTFNLNKAGIQQDIQFRRAIHLGLDRERMIKELGGLRQCASEGFVLSAAQKDYAASSDLDEPKRLIQASDYGGEPLNLYTYEWLENEKTAAWISRRCKEIGVQLNVVKLPIEHLADPKVLAQADLVMAGEVLGEQADLTLLELYQSPFSFLRNHFSSEMTAYVDGKLKVCMGEPSSSERMKLLLGIQEKLKSSSNVMFLYHSLQRAQHHPMFEGIALNAWGKIDYKHIWLKLET
ncbi:SgrR family transcriptional regulator [Paenibacillus sp. JNUCC31]|uniref:SgrR family transcriptional regulator n=1 Tax=Paenibacillus sp. JNUCC-31 TaxID=2777983 RepID=UPI00177C1C26|nr:SgrR family transcriptional regulator [Paenibacillus sp. JNUCC-31]QOS80475.1 SgrR family transcriptional regulator [Paenibacillus sp. JNUCC-31]